ncbi:MAG: ribose-5-phosphate isomerase RpiA [Chitinophagaceae bacterium]
MLSADEIKKKLGLYAADFVKQEMVIGVGTGSTVYWLIQELGKRVNQGLSINIVPTSLETEELTQKAGIPVADLNSIANLPLTIDGADEIDAMGQLIKGGGGALLQEKIVASSSNQLIIIADSSKLVSQLGRFSLPVEVIPFGYKRVQQKIMNSGMCKEVTLRQKEGQPFVTDHHHYILDCEYKKMDDLVSLNNDLHNIPGVVETGLFLNMASRSIVGYPDGRIEIIIYK